MPPARHIDRKATDRSCPRGSADRGRCSRNRSQEDGRASAWPTNVKLPPMHRQNRRRKLTTRPGRKNRPSPIKPEPNAPRAQAESDTATAQAAQAQAESDTAKAQADAAKAQSDSDKAKADMANSQAASATALSAAQADAEQSRLAAQQAQLSAQQAEADKAAMRTRLSEQLNSILQTRDSARGLIVSMSDVLFDTGKYSLKPGAREKLAKVAGILLAYPGLNIEVGGYTDNVGGDAMNQTLSENRASSVRDYLVHQGVATNSVSAKGFGNTLPVASNDNSAGRQQNRRVELLVSGDAIGNPVQRNHRKLAVSRRR